MAPDGHLQANLLGKIAFTFSGESVVPSSRKAQALLCYLALSRREVSRDALAELLWGAGKLNNLRQALYELRRLPGSERWLVDEADTVRLNTQSDVAAFEAAFEKQAFGSAVKAYQGELLSGFTLSVPAFTDWLDLERARLAHLYAEALSGYLETLGESAEDDQALDLARRIVADEPLNETAHRAIMRLEHARGNSEAALEQFERCRRIIKEELGAEPLPETLALLAEIEQGGGGAGGGARLIHSEADIPARPGALVGREQLLAEAQTLLSEKKRLLIHGFGGIGKTAVAATLCASFVTGGNALWLDLGQADPERALDALARPFEAQRQLLQTQDRAGFIRELLREGGITLVVLDDAWNAYTLSVLLETLPPDVAVVVTSRQRYPRIRRLDVGRLERGAAADLLSYYAEQALDGPDALALCEHLGDHAYALRLAGLNLRGGDMSPLELLERIRDTPHDLRIPDDLASREQGSVASLLKVSLAPLDDDAFETFLAYGGLFSAFATPDLLSFLLRRDTEYVENALFTLVTRGLAERLAVSGSDVVTYRIHDLSHAYTRAVNNYRTQSVVRAASRYLSTYSDELDRLDAELPTILGATEHADEDTLVTIARLLSLEGSYFAARGYSDQALRLIDRATDVAMRQGDLATAQELTGKQGNAYLNYRGDPDRALASYEQALELARKAGDKSREAVYLSLVGITRYQQDADDAERYLASAHTLAQDHAKGFDLCAVLEHRGYVAGSSGNYQAATAFLQSSLDNLATLERGDHDRAELLKRRFFSLNNLAQVLHLRGEYDASLEKRRQALAIAEQQDNPIWTADALYGLGETYHVTRQREDAQNLLAKALDLYEQNQARAYAGELKAFMATEGYGSTNA